MKKILLVTMSAVLFVAWAPDFHIPSFEERYDRAFDAQQRLANDSVSGDYYSDRHLKDERDVKDFYNWAGDYADKVDHNREKDNDQRGGNERD